MISLCITTYNRYDLLLESFDKVLGNPRISEIVIVDDASKPEIRNLLSETLSGPLYANRVKLHINQDNLGMSRNKARAIELASNEWCILFDSDNVIDSSYLDALPECLVPSIIYAPAYARPQFDYRKYENVTFDAEMAAGLLGDNRVEMMLNTCNYVVNRQEYLKVYEHNPDMKGTDTIWFNYLWLKAGNSIHVTRGMEYMHRVHPGSGFLEDCDYNMKKAAEVKQLIQTLR